MQLRRSTRGTASPLADAMLPSYTRIADCHPPSRIPMADFKPPADLKPFEILFDESEKNPALPPGLVDFAGNIGFPAPPEQRPWVYSNFVQSLDGMVTFGGNRPEGR